MGKIDPENRLQPETRAWAAYMRQYERGQRWFWTLASYGVAAVGYFIYCCIVQEWSPVWVSFVQVLINVFLLVMYLLSSLKLARLRYAWNDLNWQVICNAEKSVARSEGIRDYQNAMIREMRARRAAQAERDSQDNRPGSVRAQRLEIEGP